MKAPSDSRLDRHRDRVERLRQSLHERFDRGVDAVELVQALALQTDGFLVELFDEAAEAAGKGIGGSGELSRAGAILAVGGSGRAELSPGSDIALARQRGADPAHSRGQVGSHSERTPRRREVTCCLKKQE
mgnify:CR=1 FL=1